MNPPKRLIGCLVWSLVVFLVLECNRGAPVVTPSFAGEAAEPAMVFPAEAWEEATPQSQGVDPRGLERAIDYFKANSGKDGVREVVVVKSGRLIWKGDNVDKVHGVWSCTKSFTSTVLGLLIEDGKCSLDTRAKEVVPELAAVYPDVTLRHFTTMTSGYRAVGDEPQGGYKHGPSSTPFQPSSEPLFVPPGSQYAYWDSAMNLFGLVLTRIAGEPTSELFKRRIAEPIGMEPKQWDWGDYATIDGVVVNGGSGNGGKHVFISAREMARFGHLFLNKGNWSGRQLLRCEWVEAATAVQVPASTPWAHPESDIDACGCYGFNWWANGVKANGTRKWPGAPLGTFAAQGHNNNKLVVIPEWRMVIVRLGLDEGDKKITDEVLSEFIRLAGEAMTKTPAGGGVPRSGDRATTRESGDRGPDPVTPGLPSGQTWPPIVVAGERKQQDKAPPGDSPDALFHESFDDARLLERDWYDGEKFEIAREGAYAGAGCIAYHWKLKTTNPDSSSNIRHLFDPTDTVYLRFYLKLSKGWDWSGRAYHPHLMHFLTTESAPYAGPAATHLTVYIEPSGGKLRLAAQDIQNQDKPHGLTQGPLRGGYNGTFYDSKEKLFTDDQWHCVAAMFKLNSLDLKRDQPNADGIVRASFDGKLVIEHTDAILRSTDFPKMQFNQFLLAPYFGPGLLPHEQTLWIDELAVGTRRLGDPQNPVLPKRR